MHHKVYFDYFLIKSRPTWCALSNEKVYLMSNRKCCVVDFRVDSDRLDQFSNFGKIRTQAAKSNSVTFRERFDVMKILKG